MRGHPAYQAEKAGAVLQPKINVRENFLEQIYLPFFCAI